MYSKTLKFAFRVLALACVAALPMTATAQNAGAPTAAPATRPPYGDSPSKWDIFAGYSYLAPKGTVDTPMPNGTTLPFTYRSVDWGSILSVARYFNKYVGVEAIGDEHIVNETPCNCGSGSTYSNGDFSGGSGGMIFRFPSGNLTSFVHGLVGAEYVGGPNGQADRWGPVLTAGGGADYNTPLFNHHLAIRVFQADYQYIHENWGPAVNGGRANINAARLSTGFVYHIGSIAPPTPVTMACSASPASVYPGEAVTLTGTAGELDPKASTVYNWSGNGVTGNDSTAKVDTSALAPGTYTVKCGVKQGKPGKEGLKPWESADNSTTFTVKQFEPPTVSCSASPSTIKPGETSTITSTGVSPQNRPLTYSYSAASGSVNGSGNTGTFNSTGAPTGPVEVTCNVSDDKGQTATSGTSVTIAAPPPVENPAVKQLETRLALRSVFFPTNEPRVGQSGSGLVSSQEATLTDLATSFKQYLQYKPDAHLILTGHTDVRGSQAYNMALSDRRVASTKRFLVEQGISESSIETHGVGEEQQLTADQVKAMVAQDQNLSAADQDRILHKLSVFVLAQNRRVDVTLSTTGQESVRRFPFNASDAMTLLDEKAPSSGRKTHSKAKK